MSAKKTKRKTKTDRHEETLESGFRERRFSEVPQKLKHPKPCRGYKATLTGAPGWWAKENPGA